MHQDSKRENLEVEGPFLEEEEEVDEDKFIVIDVEKLGTWYMSVLKS